jgi:hypothetical protein
MTWRAPEVPRELTETLGGERVILESWLEWQRLTFLRKCSGLTGGQLARREVPPSDLSLLGLIRHLRKAERLWFRERMAGEDVPRLYAPGVREFDGVEAAEAEADYDALLEEMQTCREAAARMSLDEDFAIRGWDYRVSVRWVYLHMIEEYARHNGHADLLRERIDGSTGT